MTQPKLKAKSKTIFEVQYGDFEQFIKEVYGVRLDFVEWQECGNDSTTSLYAEKNPRVAPLTSGQSSRLQTGWSRVRILHGAPKVEVSEKKRVPVQYFLV